MGEYLVMDAILTVNQAFRLAWFDSKISHSTAIHDPVKFAFFTVSFSTRNASTTPLGVGAVCSVGNRPPGFVGGFLFVARFAKGLALGKLLLTALFRPSPDSVTDLLGWINVV